MKNVILGVIASFVVPSVLAGEVIIERIPSKAEKQGYQELRVDPSSMSTNLAKKLAIVQQAKAKEKKKENRDRESLPGMTMVSEATSQQKAKEEAVSSR